MATPNIGNFDPKELIPGGPAPDPEITPEEQSTVHDFRELTEPTGVAPNPPRCILAKFKSRDLVWRWFSEPSCKKLGLRMYETFSPDAKDREKINSGRDAPPGVRVDAENKLRWLDDAFLGVIPRRYYLQRQAIKRQRVKDLTRQSRSMDGLKEAANRAGARITDFSVEDEDVR